MNDHIYIAEYDPQWPRRFEAESARVKEVIGEVQIEHFGSTSVPGMPAKPVIDMMVAIESIPEGEDYAGLLVKNGYESAERRCRQEFPERIIVIRRGHDGSRCSHVHLLLKHHRMWKKQLAFRDYLRSHPTTASEYAVLKRSLAEQFRADRHQYMAGKLDFIDTVSEIALAEEGMSPPLA